VSEFEDDIALLASRIPQDKVKICLLGEETEHKPNILRL
jgi:hypothetical protein